MADATVSERDVSPDAALLDDLITDGIESDIFTGATAAIGTSDGIDWLTTAGERDPDGCDPVTEATLFDSASTTKAVVTTTVILRLVEEGRLALSAPIEEYIPPLEDTDRGEIPVHHFMTHTSGLQPYHYDDDWETPEQAREAILSADLIEADPGERFAYSCLNFVHLSDAARRLTGRTLADLAQEYVFEPAGMTDSRLGPLDDDEPNAAVTYEWGHADAPMHGEVHDPIGRALAGESGNAGLFTTARDMANFATEMLATARGESEADGSHVLAPSTVARATEDWLPELAGRPHGLGWRLGMDCYPAANWSPSTFGHTGYTGASIFMDPEADRFAVLLTNEVYQGKGQGMIQFRERFHGAVAGERY